MVYMSLKDSMLLLFITALLVFSGFAGIQTNTKPKTSLIDSTRSTEQQESEIIHNLANMRGWFTENRGQIQNPDVKFVYSGSGCSIGFVESGYLIRLTGDDNCTSIIQVTFEGANTVAPEGREELSHRSNYFLGDDTSQWRTGVPNYDKVVYENLYDGIDLVFYSSEKGLKYDFVVSPGAKPEQICWSYNEIDHICVDSQGALHISALGGELVEESPFSYQIRGEKKIKILSQYNVEQNKVRIKIKEYDYSIDLIIDPLIYSTFLGGSHEDGGFGITLDSNNNAYITGVTRSSNFSTTLSCYDDSLDGDYDAFVVKLNAEGSKLIYSTFIGGSHGDGGFDIVLDSSNNAYITGTTRSSDFPTTSGCYDDSSNGNNDVFIAKLNLDGSNLIYSTYVGGDDVDSGESIALDSGNNAYVTGYTNSNDFPTTTDCYDGTHNNAWDGFVCKINSGGSNLIFSTLVGGSDNDESYAIALDSNNNAYIAGATRSSDFPTSLSCYDDSLNGDYDAFVVKLNAEGSKLIYSTFIGGSHGDGGFNIVLDSSNNAYITGMTRSSDFPTTPSCYDNSLNGDYDALIIKLNSDGSDLLYSTFVGGNGLEYGSGIAIDSTNRIYIGGATESNDFPITDDSFDSSYNGEQDVFLFKVNTENTDLVYSTFIGGSDSDGGFVAVTLDSKNNVYMTGTSQKEESIYYKPFVDLEMSLQLWEDVSSPYIHIPEKTSFVLERYINITAESGNGSFNLHFPDIPEVPHKQQTTWGKTIQEIKNFDITIPEGNNFVNETRDGTWLSFEGDLSEGQEVHIRLTYTMEANAIRWDERIDRSTSGNVTDIPQSLKDQYNHDERFSKGGSKVDFIEVEKYRGLAQNVTEGESTVYGQVKAIYDYVLDNVQYVRGRDPKACTLTLNKGYGDCDDMNAVFVSLARSLGIPSWPNFGQLTNEKFSSWGGYSWVEVYIPTKDGNYYNAQIDLANKLFLIYSPTRFFEWSDTGNEDDLIYFYYYFSRTGANIDVEQELTTKDYSVSGQMKIKLDDMSNHRTGTSNFPTTSGSFGETHNGDCDAFVCKLKLDEGSGQSFEWSKDDITITTESHLQSKKEPVPFVDSLVEEGQFGAFSYIDSTISVQIKDNIGDIDSTEIMLKYEYKDVITGEPDYRYQTLPLKDVADSEGDWYSVPTSSRLKVAYQGSTENGDKKTYTIKVKFITLKEEWKDFIAEPFDSAIPFFSYIMDFIDQQPRVSVDSVIINGQTIDIADVKLEDSDEILDGKRENAHELGVDCPVNLEAYDRNGNLMNHNEGVIYTGEDSEPEFVIIGNPEEADYTIKIIGTDDGTYTLIARSIENGKVIDEKIEGNISISKGETQEKSVTLKIPQTGDEDDDEFILLQNVGPLPLIVYVGVAVGLAIVGTAAVKSKRKKREKGKQNSGIYLWPPQLMAGNQQEAPAPNLPDFQPQQLQAQQQPSPQPQQPTPQQQVPPKVKCPKCSTVIQVDPSNTTPEGKVRITCPNCGVSGSL